MTINTENFPKAELAITYRKDIYKAVNELSQYHEEYGSLILAVLEENPQIMADELKEIIFQKFDRDYKPYEDQKLNDALVDVSILGAEAVAEMKSIIDILGDTTDLAEVKKSLGIKYGNKTPERYINLSAKDEDTDLDVKTASISPLEPELIDEELRIFKVRKTTGADEYKWNGKSFYNYDRAKEAAMKSRISSENSTSNEANHNTKDTSDSSLSKDLASANSMIKTAGWFGVISLVISFFLLVSDIGPYRYIDDDFAIIELIITVGLVWGVFLRSRFAAIALFLLFVTNKFFIFQLDPRASASGIISILAFGAAYLYGAIGTIKYHKLMSHK